MHLGAAKLTLVTVGLGDTSPTAEIGDERLYPANFTRSAT